MKKVILRLGYVKLLAVLLIGWVWIVSKILRLSPDVQEKIIVFAVAPISETLFYLYLPMKLSEILFKRFSVQLQIPIMLFAGFQFILLHVDNYMYGGRYLACMFQGVMYYASYLCINRYWKKGGTWMAILLHTSYNLSIAYALPHL